MTMKYVPLSNWNGSMYTKMLLFFNKLALLLTCCIYCHIVSQNTIQFEKQKQKTDHALQQNANFVLKIV